MSEFSQTVKDNPVVLLITANVGTIFEKPHNLLNGWIKTLLQKIISIKPDFLAIHLQEVGGKTNEYSTDIVHNFVQTLCECHELQDYKNVRIYIDENTNSPENYTALGNLYFLNNNLRNSKEWNFGTHVWQEIGEKKIYLGDVESIPTKVKTKFPKNIFPQCKYSRKGFMRTRWQINEIAFDLVNIHLFHDASNLAAALEYPSLYLRSRQIALLHTLEKLYLDQENGYIGFFLFGDFNFRCDTHGVIQELTRGLITHRIQKSNNENLEIFYRNSSEDNILSVGKKQFYHVDHQLVFKENWLKKYDKELEPLRQLLDEYPITFPPSYPFEEHDDLPEHYMTTRCPSWCDRILVTPLAKEIISDCNMYMLIDYNMVGYNVCMGDHKPVYLNFRLKSKQEIHRKSSPLSSNINDIINEIRLEIDIRQKKSQDTYKKSKEIHRYIEMRASLNLQNEELIWKQDENSEEYKNKNNTKICSDFIKETSV